MQIIGHEAIASFFSQVEAAGTLSHAYLFVGRAHVGKRHLANLLASRLLNQEKYIEAHPDLLRIERARDPKKGTLKKQISIEQIRDARHFLASKPFVGSRKVAIIDEVERMSTAAANGLLKSLEEPAEGSTLFLLSEHIDQVLPTIQSRCQVCYFSPVAEHVIIEALATRGCDRQQAAAYAAASYGAPGQALRWFEEPDTFELYQEEVDRFAALADAPLYEKMKMVEPLFGDKSDHIAARDALDEVLTIWQLEARRRMQDQADAKWVEIVDRISETRIRLSQNIHPKLLVEHILLAFT